MLTETKALAIVEPEIDLKVPKDFAENMLFRSQMLTEAQSNKELQVALKLNCKQSISFFFDTFLYTYDPRVEPFSLPFITYPYENTDIIDWLLERIDKQRDGLIDKTRDMGVTWTILGVFYHQWLFRDGFLAHLGSKTEDDVDRSGDIKSLFEKLRFFIKTTPDWLLPHFDMRFMRLINEDNGNSITGESANPYFARQGRYRVIFYDEFPATEYAEDIWIGMGDSTPSRIVVGTPNGTGNKFWKLRFEELAKDDIRTIHWTKHPKKAAGIYTDKEGRCKYSYVGKQRSPWYDAECERRTAVEVAQELDIDYLASGSPYFNLHMVAKQKEWKLGEIAGDGVYELGIMAKVEGKVVFRPNRNGNVMIFEHPSKITQATIASDPAEGLEHGDKTSIAVRCKRTGNLLAGFYGTMAPEEAAVIEGMLSQYYNGALTTAEMGGYGLVMNQYLWDVGINVFRDVDTRHGGEKEGKKLGFNTKRHRAEMLNLLASEIDGEAIELRAKALITECMNFTNKDGKPQASEGATDDFIFAFAMAGMLAYWYPYSKKQEQGALGRKSSGDTREAKKNMGFAFAKGPQVRRRF